MINSKNAFKISGGRYTRYRYSFSSPWWERNAGIHLTYSENLFEGRDFFVPFSSTGKRDESLINLPSFPFSNKAFGYNQKRPCVHRASEALKTQGRENADPAGTPCLGLSFLFNLDIVDFLI